MTAKQYAGLLALSCVIASPFVANQWLKFAKAQHEYQEQLESERHEAAAQAERARNYQTQVFWDAIKDTPLHKQWDNFAQTVDWLKKTETDQLTNATRSC
jgi:hypothetical protein